MGTNGFYIVFTLKWCPVSVSSRAGTAAEFVDPRLTAPENDAARNLVRRFVDAVDGQACYLDVWITLYHAVFRSGKVGND